MKISLSIPAANRGCTPAVRREQRALFYQECLNAQARINAEWVLEEWRQGRTPKCCAKCNGTRYVPDVGDGDGMSETVEILSSPDLFARGHGSCGSIAACHTGHKIAEAVAGKFGNIGRIPWEEACRRFVVKMAPGPDRNKPMLMHAICVDDGKVLDPTIGMAR